jgi:hypothetical protein
MIKNLNNNKTRAEQLIEKNASIRTHSEETLRKKTDGQGIPEVSNYMAKSVSSARREMMEMQMEFGELREQGSGFSTSNKRSENMAPTSAGFVTYTSRNSNNRVKLAGSATISGTTNGWRGSNNTVNQMPELYSPIWLNSNLSLPRDRATINAWSRSFFALNPIVHNSITLHSTYPIAKLNIKSKNRDVEKFFSQMIDEIDLMNICVMIAQEYWILGEAFIYAELDESKGSWSRLMILNPDYVNVQRSVIAAEPIISLRPDENLRRVVFGNQPSDLHQKKQLDPSIIEHVRKNENIPLNNFYVSHIARRISPYEIRGTGLVVSCFRALMLWDRLRESKYAQADGMINPLTLVKIGDADFKPTPVDLEHWREIFECYDDETEVLTNQGFKYFKDVIDYSEVDGKIISSPKPGISVACFNEQTEMLEYHIPTKSYVNNYNGPMYHFHNTKIDIKVTPDHDMWVSENVYEYNPKRFKLGDFKKKKAKDLHLNDYNNLGSVVNWIKSVVNLGGDNINSVSMVEEQIDHFNIDHYNGKIWCFTVPTGLFVTRRNGKITIQGNSAQSDKDFKIFTHNAVNVERVGYGQGIYDTSADITQLIKEIYIGLMVPSVIMDGSDTTYATGSVALDVLRQRYMQFRQYMTSWLKTRIFAPISQINDFYEYEDGKKTLIVPEVDWNHMSLFDMDSFINNLAQLSQGEGTQKRVSLQTLYRSIGLEYEEEQRKIRYEDIQDAIRMKEIAALARYPLHELKSLGPNDEINEAADEPVPGQSPYEPMSGEGGQMAGGLGGSGLSGMPTMPGAPPSAPIGGGGAPRRPSPPPMGGKPPAPPIAP